MNWTEIIVAGIGALGYVLSGVLGLVVYNMRQQSNGESPLTYKTVRPIIDMSILQHRDTCPISKEIRDELHESLQQLRQDTKESFVAAAAKQEQMRTMLEEHMLLHLGERK